MFAIRICRENIEKILQESDVTEADLPAVLPYCLNSKMWYLVRGYYDRRGVITPWVILPAYVIEKNYEYDPIKIKTDWDQIVRK